MGDLLCAEQLEMAFGGEEVLDGVDFAVEDGEAVAVVGANGAGKTTLVKILAGVLSPVGGRVTVQGDELAALSRREIARRMAVVPQSRPQVFGFTVLDFVLMGYHAQSSLFLPSSEQKKGAHRALRKLGMESFAQRSVARLSGGEMQRALMARAAVADAPVWLLDEPTASLDMHHQVSLLERVVEHVDGGNAAVAVLHDLALVHRFFDRVAVLHDGQITADGAPGEVLTPSVVSEVYGVEMQRGTVDGKVVWVVA